LEFLNINIDPEDIIKLLQMMVSLYKQDGYHYQKVIIEAVEGTKSNLP